MRQAQFQEEKKNYDVHMCVHDVCACVHARVCMVWVCKYACVDVHV